MLNYLCLEGKLDHNYVAEVIYYVGLSQFLQYFSYFV